jgi:hypothetical protein
MPLHGEKGGPMMCPFCCGNWHGEHGKKRKFGRILIKAMKAYLAAGGRSSDIDKLKQSATIGSLKVLIGFDVQAISDPLGYGADSIGADVGDITTELLTDTLQLTHPDRHPPERRAVTQAHISMRGMRQHRPLLLLRHLPR